MKKKHYLAPSCSAVAVNPETMIAASGEKLMVGGTDTSANKGTNDKTWGEVKTNTVDWDE